MSSYRIAPPLEILRQACREYGLAIEFIGDESGHLAKVSCDNRFFYSGGAMTPTYPLNSAVAQDLCLDKSYSSELLKSAGLTTPAGRLFFPEFSSNNRYQIIERGIPDAIRYVADEIGYPVIVKPNRGSMGRGVRLVENDTDLVLAMQKTVEQGHACLVQEAEQGKEHRLFCIDGKPVFLYRKEKLKLVGDGESNVLALLAKQVNVDLSKLDLAHVEDTLRGHFHDADVSVSGSVWEYVPDAGIELAINSAGNIALGARIEDLQTSFNPLFYEFASLVADSLQVRIFGVDFFAPDNASHVQDLSIIEVNGNPSLRGIWDQGHRDLVLEIWGRIFGLYFEAEFVRAR